MMKRLFLYFTLPAILTAVLLSACDNALRKVEVTESKAEIVFDTLSHDFGNVLPDTTVSFGFVFHNIGATPLHLESVVPGCHCTKTEWPKGGIEPGEAGVITVIYDTHGSTGGHFQKSIKVYSNAKSGFLRLAVSGDVVGD